MLLKICRIIKNIWLLYQCNLNDMIVAASIKTKMMRFITKFFLAIFALIFTVTLIRYDQKIEKLGIQKASLWLIKKYYADITTNSITIPDTGAVLLACNHPGVGDTTALLAMIQRTDIKIVVLDKPIFKLLPHLASYLIVLKDTKLALHQNILGIMQHLKAKGIVLLYPAGTIEPDPQFCQHEDYLKEWRPLLGYLCLKLKRCDSSFMLAPILTQNVLAKNYFSAYFLKLKKHSVEREKLIALYTLLLRPTKKQNVIINFKPLISSDSLALTYANSAEITDVVKAMIKNLKS